MANEIKLITFANSEVTATDDAYVYESAIGEGGIINGCEVTIKNASELHINGGNGVLCGRKFTVYDSDLPVTLSSSGTLLGRLYIHMDLSNASTPIQLMIETGGSLTPVQQDADVNATNGVYEVNLATFDVDTSTISNLVDVAPKTGPHTVLNTIEDCVASTNPNDIAGASVAATLNSKIAHYKKTTGTGSATLSAALAALTDNEYLHSFISINDGGYNIGNHLLRPYDLRAGIRYYYDTLIPFNASNIAVSWQAIRNNSANTFSYTQNVQPVSGSFSSTDKTSSIGAWELYIAEGA